MNHIRIEAALAAAVLILGSGFAMADETKPAVTTTAPATAAPVTAPSVPAPGKPASTKAKAKAKARVATRRAKPTPNQNVVELNTASKDQLKTLPGITDAFADKLIAGRPYVSKIEITTRHILPDGFYTSLRHLIYVVPAVARKKK